MESRSDAKDRKSCLISLRACWHNNDRLEIKAEHFFLDHQNFRKYARKRCFFRGGGEMSSMESEEAYTHARKRDFFKVFQRKEGIFFHDILKTKAYTHILRRKSRHFLECLFASTTRQDLVINPTDSTDAVRLRVAWD